MSSERILVDIPIGLGSPTAPVRACDRLARACLMGRASSVFSPPIREVIGLDDYAEGCARSRELIGKAFSKQAWNIAGKIREVDTLLLARSDLRPIVRESHPEVCFQRLHGSPLTQRKKEAVVVSERRQILAPLLGDVDAIVSDFRVKTPRKDADLDDILDAMVLAVTAANLGGPAEEMPDLPETDAKGFPMALVVPPEHPEASPYDAGFSG